MNQSLTARGEEIVQDISQRYNLSYDSTVSMLVSVNNGGGSMAQFSIPELGSGQWMSGGMTMVGDMFNYGLKNTVNNLCGELSNALASNQIFQPVENAAGGGGNNWWPGDLGSPSSSGGQNNTRYAYFPSSRRLAVEKDGQVSVFDTLDHNIGGVSQQQGGGDSLTFSSQYGTVTTLSLPLVSGAGFGQQQNTNFAQPQVSEPVKPSGPSESASAETQQPSGSTSQSSSELMGLLEQLGKLRDAGVLDEQEFQTKKADILSRI